MKKRAVALVTATLFGAGRFFARAARVCNHLAAGTLTIRELRAGIERIWEEFNARDADGRGGLTRCEEELIARFVTRDDDVLLVGSGTGPTSSRSSGRLSCDGGRPATARHRHVPAAARDAGLSADIIEDSSRCRAPRRFDVTHLCRLLLQLIPESRGRSPHSARPAIISTRARGRILVNFMTDRRASGLIKLARLAAR